MGGGGYLGPSRISLIRLGRCFLHLTKVPRCLIRGLAKRVLRFGSVNCFSLQEHVCDLITFVIMRTQQLQGKQEYAPVWGIAHEILNPFHERSSFANLFYYVQPCSCKFCRFTKMQLTLLLGKFYAMQIFFSLVKLILCSLMFLFF